MAVDKFNLRDAMQTFFVESREMLEEMESCLLKLEKDPGDSNSIHALFRSVHTIKGSSGMFGFDEIEKFTHVVENCLDQVRNGVISIDPDLTSLLFECHDCIDELLTVSEENDGRLTAEFTEQKNGLIYRLNAYLGASAQEPAPKEKDDTPAEDEYTEEDESVAGSDYWHISLRFGPGVFKDGYDPYSFINYLNEIGEIIHIVAIDDGIPDDDEMDPELCYLGFELEFSGDVKKEKIEDVFEFIRDDCEVRILPPKSSIEEYLDLIDELPESSMKLGEILVRCGALTQGELDEALKRQITGDGEIDGTGVGKKQIGDIILEEKMIPKPVLDAAIEKQENIKKAEIKNRKLIRINTDRVDNLVNLVGELVITGSNVKQLSERNDDTELNESVSTMTRLIEDIRDSTMNIRMVPIGETFRKFERVVRDLSREQGKEVDLIITGGDTELDKTLIDKISDPLMHLVRNAVDHGIDTPAERQERGKPGKGSIFLNSYYETGSVVIVTSDDGNGLDREKIYQKAVALGYIIPGENIPDSDLYQFIFEPGFSTAREVTNISGRGVGMDVVKRNIEALRGTIVMESEPGKGTSIRIHLPLTLAIIDGFMVQVGDHYYVIPLDMVIECTEVVEEDLKNREGGNFINLRGEVLPYMRMRDFFKDSHERPGKENVIVVEYARKMAGLVVDRPVGELQTVIKPLGKVFSQLKWISGATILGSGEVALILDVPRLIDEVEKRTGVKTDKEAGAVR